MAAAKYPGLDGIALKYIHTQITNETKDVNEFILSNMKTEDGAKTYLDVYREVYGNNAKL
ncbi:hypothetical protein M5X11_34765 [Paenibacillus alginolyticus]|uniref:hypothetical protein n=1 Tax=Paenibacillus alginolyticus TaxID=59839 RepID=UPI0003F65F20|nr:hypothetical protein [Paenibacillus alginolyticus]MCY9670002.1 hypothetical protein [Paenibacillus alginolyticus]